MNLYLISQSVNNGYDTYSSAVVAAETPEAAKAIHPGRNEEKWWERDEWMGSWAKHPDQVEAELIGRTKMEGFVDDTKPGLILASFHAG